MASESFFATLLRVEPAGPLAFTARLHDHGGAAFGGDLLGKVALAAAYTCADKSLSGLQASFLRELPPGQLVSLRVSLLSDGRRVARRRVEAWDGARLLCAATASFSAPAAGAEWQECDAEVGRLAPPELLPPDVEVAAREGWDDWDPEREEYEWRFIDRLGGDSLAPGGAASAWRLWLRPRQPLPDDPAVHAAALAHLSDLLSQWSATRRLGRELGPRQFGSLDHALFVHRTVKWSDWWLLHDQSEVAHGGRVFWRRQIYDRQGVLLASVAQDAWLATD